jgi:hypothetical protein
MKTINKVAVHEVQEEVGVDVVRFDTREYVGERYDSY